MATTSKTKRRALTCSAANHAWLRAEKRRTGVTLYRQIDALIERDRAKK